MSMPDDHSSVPGPSARRILVTGATGRFGAVADLLLQRGHTVRAATRNPARPAAADLAARGAEIVRADFDDAASLAVAARGMDAVFATGTAHRAGPAGEERHGRNLAEALARIGSPHLVFVSGAGADRPTGVPVLDAKGSVERHIRALALPATVIAPAYLMENLLNPWNLPAIRAGVLPTPVPPTQRLQQTATADILALAVQSLEHPDTFTGARIEVASDAPTGTEAAAALSRLLGQPFTARQLSRNDLPPGLAALFAWLEREPPAVEIAALRRRFPDIAWHDFAGWAREQRARLGEASGSASSLAARPGTGAA